MALLLSPLPVLGFLTARAIEHRCAPDTNGNTLAMIAKIVSLWILPFALVGLLALWILWSASRGNIAH